MYSVQHILHKNIIFTHNQPQHDHLTMPLVSIDFATPLAQPSTIPLKQFPLTDRLSMWYLMHYNHHAYNPTTLDVHIVTV